MIKEDIAKSSKKYPGKFEYELNGKVYLSDNEIIKWYESDIDPIQDIYPTIIDIMDENIIKLSNADYLKVGDVLTGDFKDAPKYEISKIENDVFYFKEDIKFPFLCLGVQLAKTK